jgi:hypothetical protein
MSAKWAFRLAVISAVVMLSVSTLMVVTAAPCHPLPMSTLTAFELVRSVADLQRIFGVTGDACRADLVSQLDHANVIDTFAYIPAYTGFYALVAFALAASPSGRRNITLGWITIAIALGCAVADVFENVSMFRLSAAPDVASPWLTGLIASTNAKWVGLAVVTTLCGVMLARRGGLWWLAPIACAVPLASSLWALAAPDAAGQYLIPGMVVPSVLLLAVAVWGSLAHEKPASS